jgi:hypothetical protein
MVEELVPSEPVGFAAESRVYQGCQMVYFETKNHNLGKFWRVLPLNTYVGMYILKPFGLF